MTTEQLLINLKEQKIVFTEVIFHIETIYTHTPTAFTNGTQRNEEIQNQGSAKVLGFAKLENLSKEDTLWLFAEHYQSVLNTPDDTDHQNIHQFMIHGWDGVTFEGIPLTKK